MFIIKYGCSCVLFKYDLLCRGSLWSVLFPSFVVSQSLSFDLWTFTVAALQFCLFFCPFLSSGLCWGKSSAQSPFFTVISMKMYTLFFQIFGKKLLGNDRFFTNFIFVLISAYPRIFSSAHKCENFWNFNLLNWCVTPIILKSRILVF